MRNSFLFLFILFFSKLTLNAQTINSRVVLAYFPSWSESYAGNGQNSKLREIPSYVNYVFLSFAKPDLTYVKGSYDIKGTGIETPYDGCTLKESVAALKQKGINVILSIGGETFWTGPSVYANINYQAIKDLVDDIGFVGIDWDFEPEGSFTNIGNSTNVQHFIDFITNSRALMPKSQGYIIACAPSGVGALGGQTNNDPTSPFSYSKRNTLTGESDANLYQGTVPTNGINLFGFSATGHMIPVFSSVGNSIDLVAFQGYNCGASTNRSIMYDAYAYYAEIYGFTIAAGVHFPNEPWGPYFNYYHKNVASLSGHIKNYTNRTDNYDGIMIWQLLASSSKGSAYSYLNVASKVLNGTNQSVALADSTAFSVQTYTGGAQDCAGGGASGNLYCGVSEYNATSTYANPNTQVYYQCKVWKNQWYANPNEIPGSNSVWVEVSACNEGPTCGGQPTLVKNIDPTSINFFPNPIKDILNFTGLTNKIIQVTINDIYGKIIKNWTLDEAINYIDLNFLPKGIYLLQINDQDKKSYYKIEKE